MSVGTEARAQQAEPRIAVIVPCYNEALTVGTVVARARAAMPTATVYF
jgi:glycosyltransferase involved in cell wall biosynthesis